MTITEQEAQRLRAANLKQHTMPATPGVVPAAKIMPTNGTITIPATPPDATDRLLATAAKHPAAKVRNLAEKIRVQLDQLRTLVVESQRETEIRTTIQVLRSQIDKHEAELRALREKKSRPSTGSEPVALPWKEIRAWATANGYTVPDVGRVNGRIVDEWRQATGGAA